MNPPPASPWRVLLPICIGTAFSLFGDTTLYTVLATHTEEAGVLFASVGILLSVNRWVRLPLNGIAGRWIENRRRRPLFLAALFLAVVSTAIYGLNLGYPIFLSARALWGIAWVGIWILGNTMVMDISSPDNRGRYLGFYQVAFFTGAGGGALLGGLMTDWLGYQPAMYINALLTLLGALAALLFLPETYPGVSTPGPKPEKASPVTGNPDGILSIAGQKKIPSTSKRSLWLENSSAALLLAVNRLVMPGLLLSTFAIFLQQEFGETASIAGFEIGTTSLTGISLSATTLVSLLAAPISGAASDRQLTRWNTAALWLLPGMAGFMLLTLGTTLSIPVGLVGIAAASGSGTNLATSLTGDLSLEKQEGRRLGFLFTVGDLASAVGPVLAFALLGQIGLQGIYWLAAGAYSLMFLIALLWIRKKRSHLH